MMFFCAFFGAQSNNLITYAVYSINLKPYNDHACYSVYAQNYTRTIKKRQINFNDCEYNSNNVTVSCYPKPKL